METSIELNKIVANNIIEYRKMLGLTQADLAEKLNFSDKSISKWERGEAIPDLEVLLKLCDIFGITLNDIVSTQKKRPIQKWFQKWKRLIISLMSAGLVWLIATIVFVTLELASPETPMIWMSFIYAIPVSALVLFIFSCIWDRPIVRMLLLSVFVWTTMVSICIPFGKSIWLLLCIAVPLQILIILWYILIRLKHKNKKDV